QSNHAIARKLLYRFVGISDGREHAARMLTQARRRQPHLARRGREFDSWSDLLERAFSRMVKLGNQAAMAHLRIIEHFGDIVDERQASINFIESGEPLSGSSGAEDSGERGDG